MRHVKDPIVLEEMCLRLEQLIDCFYAGDRELVVRIMRYETDTTLRKALQSRRTFPDVERLHFLAKVAQGAIAIPNMNWLVNGLEEPLLALKKGKVVGQLSFGQYVDHRVRTASVLARRMRNKVRSG